MFMLFTSIMMGCAAFLVTDQLLKFWDKLSSNYVEKQMVLCKEIGIDIEKVPFYMRIWGATIILILVIGYCCHYFLIFVIFAFFVFVLPEQCFGYIIRKRKRVLREQLIRVLSIVVNSVKAGLTLEQSVEVAANESREPLKHTFETIIMEYKSGKVFEDALNQAKLKLNMVGFILFVTALTTNLREGGDVTKTLEAIQKNLIENQRLERMIEANTATGHMVIVLLAVFPIFFLLISYSINPSGTALLFNNIVGQITLIISTMLVYIGYKYGEKIMNIEF